MNKKAVYVICDNQNFSWIGWNIYWTFIPRAENIDLLAMLQVHGLNCLI